MIKSQELTEPTSCINKAADDEPVFVLRANDPRASAIVRAWAADYRYVKGGPAKMTTDQMAKFTEACQLADAMDKWRVAHGG